MPENDANVKGFFLYLDQYQPIAGLTDAQLGQLLRAMFAWHEGKPVTLDDPMVGLAFGFFRQMFERDRQRREEYIEKQRDNGKKGGRPPKNPTVISETHGNPKNPTVISETHGNPKNPTVISETQPNPKKPNYNHDYNHEHDLRVKSSLRSDFSPELSAEAADTAGVDAALPPPVATLPLNSGEEYHITAEQVAHWQELYPAVDVMQALRSMQGWLETHPRKRKTARGVLGFVTGWLDRDQNRGGAGNNPRASPQPQRPQAKPGDFDPDRQAQIMRNVLARHMAREAEAQEAQR